jgi:methylated-DNA-[protein]-cysteine S-methyltransferase
MAARAAAEGAADVAYAIVPSPLGALAGVCSRRGLLCLSYRVERLDELLDSLAGALSPRIVESPARLDAVARQLDEYFAGRRRRFELPIDWSLSRGFARRVLRATARVPYGTATTYTEVAGRAGSPLAVRAAGNALAANPVPIVVPCHRVLRVGGGLGGYAGGLQRKRFLLELEGALEG